jgi:hypothetical protein
MVPVQPSQTIYTESVLHVCLWKGPAQRIRILRNALCVIALKIGVSSTFSKFMCPKSASISREILSKQPTRDSANLAKEDHLRQYGRTRQEDTFKCRQSRQSDACLGRATLRADNTTPKTTPAHSVSSTSGSIQASQPQRLSLRCF